MLIFASLTTDELYMYRCLQLAAMGAGNTAPNPMVGAVLVYGDRIIGEGFHRCFGGAHAEVNCISSVNNADEKFISGSTLYVSLEPCTHFGKTPPCTDLILDKKIPAVVIGCKDISDKVGGRGIPILLNAGINVTVGILEREAYDLNRRFFTFHQRKRPYIILKWAQSSDAILANPDGSGIPISNEFTRRLVHKWRSEEAAILVGTNTAFNDDPALTTRLWKGKDPLRLVIDRQLKLPSSLKLFDGSVKTVVFNRLKSEESSMLSYYKVDGVNELKGIMDILYHLQVLSVLVEGGAKTLQSFIDAGLWDESRIITNEQLRIGEGIKSPVLHNAKFSNEVQCLTDKITCLFNEVY